MKNKPLYCCFSVPQRDYLMEHGMRYEVCGLNPTTKKMFWVFMRNEKLNMLLAEWTLTEK